MDRPMKIIQPNETTKLLDKLNTIFYILGMKNFWISEVALSQRFINIYNKVEYFIYFLNMSFVISIVAAFYTQNNLTEQQSSDRLIFGLILPGYFTFYLFLLFHKVEVKEILYHLAVVLKAHRNDASLELEMVRKIKVFSMTLTALVGFIVSSSGLIALYRVITTDENFITIIPAWPDVYDTSTAAGAMRVLCYINWYLFSAPLLASFSLLVTMMIAICYQFKNLQNYFYSLNDIFYDKNLSQDEKEMKYEQAFRIGIQMHALTLWCKKKNQHVCREIFATEIIVFFGVLTSQITTLLSAERSLSLLLKLLSSSLATLLGLGFFMWNGGDITVEASKLPEAMYSSGWQNCYGQSSVRIRKLVVNAMRQAQEPVVYKTLGVIGFSYETYVTVVKMPYTAVSVLY